MKKVITILLSLIISFAIIYPCKAADSYIYINKTEATLETGDTTQLLVNLNPEYIAWESDHPDIAEVTKTGKVTAISPGVATITAYIYGYRINCTITVVEAKEEPISHLEASRKIVILPIIDEIDIKLHDYKVSDTKIRLNPMKTDIVDCSWQTNDDNSIEINFKSLKAGFTDIYVFAEYEDGTKENIIISVIVLEDILTLMPII